MLPKLRPRKRSRNRSSAPKRARPRSTPPLIGYLAAQGCFVNLSGDYRYLSSGYYASQDQEPAFKACHPTCKEALDAYVPPLFLEKARLAGLKVPRSYLTNGSFEPPVVIDTVNPFMRRRGVFVREGEQDGLAKSLTRNFTYSICCQEAPPGAGLARVQTVLGWCYEPRFRALAAQAWQVFHIPLAVLRFLTAPDGDVLLSGLEPLPLQSLGRRELGHLRRVVQWPT